MQKLRYLAFEINNNCQLTGVHKECPRNADRFCNSRSSEPITVSDIASFYRFCAVRGFGGLVNLHYYNDPLCTKERMLDIMEDLPEANFSLWTNGIGLHRDPRKNRYLRRFKDVMITIYPHADVQTLSNCKLHYPHIRFQTGNLDGRAREDIKTEYNPRFNRCNRPEWELIIDYYGNGHVCCGDWKAEIWIGNIKNDPYSEFIAAWERAKRGLLRQWDALSYNDLPEVCKLCLARSPYISQVSDADTVSL